MMPPDIGASLNGCRRGRNLALATLIAACAALAAVPAAQAASCAGKKATVKPKGKSGQTKRLKGTNGDDVIVSEGGKQKITAKGGNDIICSGKGADNIRAGEGDDLIFGGGGGDKIDGELGNDTIHGEHGGDRIADTGGGDDTITGDDGGDDIDSGPGNDQVNGMDGADDLRGGDGVDMVLGERGADKLDGGPGDGDKVLAGIDNDNGVSGGDGNADIVSGQSGDDEGVTGGPGNGDHVNGNFGNDEVDGGDGDGDVVGGGTGNDKLSGGGGVRDIVSFVDAVPAAGAGNNGITVDLASGTATGEGGNDNLSGFEDIIGSAFDDKLIGATTASRIDGFLGKDTCANDNPKEEISCGEILPTPVCAVTCVDYDPKRLDGVPHLVVLGTAGNNGITVDFTGGAFVVSDTSIGIRALAGCKQSVAGVTAAVPVGPVTCPTPPLGPNALVYAGDGNDTVTLTGSVPTSVPFKLTGGPGDDSITGGPGDDLIDGGVSGNDVLNGGDGSDVLNSRVGADQMHGGGDDDLLETSTPCDGHLFDGGGGTDNASFAPSQGYDVTATIGGNAVDKGKSSCVPSQILSSNEYLEGSPGNDTLIGDNSNNSLLGRSGKDTLMGMGGNDTINGLEGADTFEGGAGKDEIRAQDGGPDAKIDCGPPNALELALVDKQDPRASGCQVKKGKKKHKKH